MNILFLQKRPLFPPDTGGKIRTLNVLRYLARWHNVTYLCNVQPDDEPHLPAMRELGVSLETLPWSEAPRGSWRFWLELTGNLMSPLPYTVAKDFDRHLEQRAQTLLDLRRGTPGAFDLVICDFAQMAENAARLRGAPKILFEHNVEAQLLRRHAEMCPGVLRRWFMGMQADRMRRFESAAGRRFDRIIAVSDADRRTFHSEFGWDHVDVIDTAVDIEYFCPGGLPDFAAEANSNTHQIVFVGSLDWRPNEDGVQWFAREIWPLIRAEVPAAQFQIVGRNPPTSVRQLDHLEGVQVVGTVPDVRPYLSTAAAVVVPLRIGGGTRIKIFEAMAMQKAVVSTPLGAEGLPVEHNHHLLLCEQPQAFADSVVSLLHHPSRRESLAVHARQLVTQRYSAETVARQFEAICLATVQEHGQEARRPHATAERRELQPC